APVRLQEGILNRTLWSQKGTLRCTDRGPRSRMAKVRRLHSYVARVVCDRPGGSAFFHSNCQRRTSMRANLKSLLPVMIIQALCCIHSYGQRTPEIKSHLVYSD